MDPKLQKIGLMLAREVETIQKLQAEKVFPGSRLAKSIRVVPILSDNKFSFKTEMVSYGVWQDKGTYGRKRKRPPFGPFNPNPARRGRRKTWEPSGITPSFFTSVGGKNSQRLTMMMKTAFLRYAKSLLPSKITLKVS